jgi:hypothetical protein
MERSIWFHVAPSTGPNLANAQLLSHTEVEGYQDGQLLSNIFSKLRPNQQVTGGLIVDYRLRD